MSKSKPKSFRSRASHAWEKMLGSSSPAASPSRSTTPRPTTSPPAIELPPPSPSQGEPISRFPSLSVAGTSSPVPSVQILPPPEPSPEIASSSPHSNNQRSAPNPIRSGSVAWNGFRTALGALHKSSSLFPLLQSAIGGLASCVNTFEEYSNNTIEFEALTLELKMLSESLDRHFRESKSTPMSEFIAKTAQSIQEQVDLIAARQDRNISSRLLGVEQDKETLIGCYRQIEVLFRQLQVDADLSTWSIANKHLTNTYLNDMKPAKLATYDSSLSTQINRRTCTKDTRTAILNSLNDWATDPAKPNIYWMNGMAGTGKTTIACTFAGALKKRKLLGASFFCTRTSAECQDVTRIIPTIAYQLARYSIPFQSALCRVLDNDPDIAMRTISTQFESLIKEPLLEVKAAIPEGLVVIIDALDECTATKGIELVLDMLFQAAPGLPLKFFVASRPEPSVRKKVESQPHHSRSVFILHEVKQSEVQADIELYLREELKSVSRTILQRLVELSGNLFIYAATVVRYLQSGNLHSRLEIMLSVKSTSNTKHAEIDELYATILSTAFNDERLEKEEKEVMRLVLWTGICAREPMCVKSLAMMAGVNEEKAFEALQPLWSVLYVSGGGNLVSTLHASFPDFMFDQTRSFQFACDAKQHHQLLAERCFEMMKTELRFNICGLESSFVSDDEVPKLDERVGQVISPSLAYCCRYWADHLHRTVESDGLCSLLHDFLSERLLPWMEVMNLKHWMKLGIRVILTAKLWLMATRSSSELVRLVEDGLNFVTSFATSSVSHSTAHLYVSALPLCYRSSTVYKHYWTRTQGLIKPEGTAIESRKQPLIASWKVDSPITSIVYSPDGALLAIGCDDGSVIVKDAHDGNVAGTPLHGHTGRVMSIAFSPDGTHIVSGAEDCTIRIWNLCDDCAMTSVPLENYTKPIMSVSFSLKGTDILAASNDGAVFVYNMQNNTLVRVALNDHPYEAGAIAFSSDCTRIVSGSKSGGIGVWDVKDGAKATVTFQGHTDSVLSVAFSPDNTKIASGSSDCTVRIWGVQEGTLVGVPLVAHDSFVRSVAFSPAGTHVVSSSDDGKISLWNAEDGTIVGSPLKSAIGFHSSVVWSPDGTRIVSGCKDRTIRVWNIQDASLASASFQGHTDWVRSVAFSPDGTRVVSASDDRILRVWNAQDGNPLGVPFQAGTDWVYSVACSSDGTRLVSGSRDCTICVWKLQDGTPAGTPLQGHTDFVRSVAFSPDGTRIASGSDDHTIRVWNTQDGSLVGVPLLGHTRGVNSVAYSPDGASIVSGSSDHTIGIWSAADGVPLVSCKGHSDGVSSVAFSPDGMRVASGSQDHTVRIWSVQEGTLVGDPLKGHAEEVRSVAFSPNGRYIVSGSQDRTICVWSVKSGVLACSPLRGHASVVTSVAFSPDSTCIVSGSGDHTVRIWRVQDGTVSGALLEERADSELSPSLMSPCPIRPCDAFTNPSIIDWWIPDEDGWVRGKDSQLIIWVPYDLIEVFPSQHDSCVIGERGAMRARFDSLLLGEDWHRCYIVE